MLLTRVSLVISHFARSEQLRLCRHNGVNARLSATFLLHLFKFIKIFFLLYISFWGK